MAIIITTDQWMIIGLGILILLLLIGLGLRATYLMGKG
jgi:hypothetical protein